MCQALERQHLKVRGLLKTKLVLKDLDTEQQHSRGRSLWEFPKLLPPQPSIRGDTIQKDKVMRLLINEEVKVLKE